MGSPMWCWLLLSVSLSHSCQDPVNDLRVLPELKISSAPTSFSPNPPGHSFPLSLSVVKGWVFVFVFQLHQPDLFSWKLQYFEKQNIKSKQQSTLSNYECCLTVSVSRLLSLLASTVGDDTTRSPTPNSSSLLTGCPQVFVHTFSFTNPLSFGFPFLLLQAIITWIQEENAAQR